MATRQPGKRHSATTKAAVPDGPPGEPVEANVAPLRVDSPHTPAEGAPGDIQASQLVGGRGAALDPAFPEQGNRVSEATEQLTLEQVHRQAEQLADQLRSRQHDLDRREAQLNAGFAQLENQLRLSRLWIRERHEALHEHETELQQQMQAREQDQLRELARHKAEIERQLGEQQATILQRDEELVRREAAIAAAQAVAGSDYGRLQRDLERQVQQLNDRDQALQRRADELEHEATRWAQETEALRTAQQRWQEERRRGEDTLTAERQRLQVQRVAIAEMQYLLLRNLQKRRRALEEREHHAARLQHDLSQRPQPQTCATGADIRLQEMETMLAQHLAQLEQDKQQLDRERKDFHQQMTAQRSELERQVQDSQLEREDQTRKLRVRAEAMQHQEVGLQRLHTEVSKLHREALEMRLAAEQTWAQLLGRTTPEQLTETLVDLRARLADHYRLAQRSLAEQKEAMRKAAARLNEQQLRLRDQRSELQGWFQRRQTEVEQQAARLVAREQELDHQQRRMQQERQDWRQQRRQYQQQLRALMGRLRSPSEAEALEAAS